MGINRRSAWQFALVNSSVVPPCCVDRHPAWTASPHVSVPLDPAPLDAAPTVIVSLRAAGEHCQPASYWRERIVACPEHRGTR